MASSTPPEIFTSTLIPPPSSNTSIHQSTGTTTGTLTSPSSSLSSVSPPLPLSSSEQPPTQPPLPLPTSTNNNAVVPPPPSSIDNLLTILASPTVFLEDIGRCEHWYIESNLLEISIYGGLLGIMAIGGLLGIFSLGIVFLPLLLFRLIGLSLDIAYLSCNIGWANRFLRRSSFYLLPKIIRIIDEIGGTLSCLLLLFVSTNSNGLLYLPRPGVVYTSTDWKPESTTARNNVPRHSNPFIDSPSIYQTIFAPLWLSTGIQIGAILTLIACSLFARSAVWLGNIYDINYDPLAIRRPIPLLRLLCTSLFNRILIISLNCLTIPLALKLDNYDSIPWSTVFYIPWLWISLATVMLIILFIGLVCESLSKYNVPVRSKVYFGFGCLGILMNIIVFGSITLEWLQKEFLSADARRTMNPLQGFYLPYLSLHRIMIPWLTFLIITICLMWFIYQSLLTKWRHDLSFLYGVSTPSTHQAVQFAYLENLRQQQRSQSGTNASSLFSFRNTGPILTPPTELIKLTYDLYRRSTPTDHIDELKLVKYPLFCTPTKEKGTETREKEGYEPKQESKYEDSLPSVEPYYESVRSDGPRLSATNSSSLPPNRRSSSVFLHYFYSAPSTITSPLAVEENSGSPSTDSSIRNGNHNPPNAVSSSLNRLSLSPRHLRKKYNDTNVNGTSIRSVPGRSNRLPFIPTVLSPIMSRTSTLSIHQNVHTVSESDDGQRTSTDVSLSVPTKEVTERKQDEGETKQTVTEIRSEAITTRDGPVTVPSLRTLSSPSRISQPRTGPTHRLHLSLPPSLSSTTIIPHTTTAVGMNHHHVLPRPLPPSTTTMNLYVPRRKRYLSSKNAFTTGNAPKSNNGSSSTVLPLIVPSSLSSSLYPLHPSRKRTNSSNRRKAQNNLRESYSYDTEEDGNKNDNNDNVDDTNNCMICCSEPSNAVLLECGHGGLCFLCSNKLRQSTSITSRRCPFCRSFIDCILRIPPPSEQMNCVIPVYQCNTYTMDSIVPTVTFMNGNNDTVVGSTTDCTSIPYSPRNGNGSTLIR